MRCPILADICIVTSSTAASCAGWRVAYADREKAERFAWLRDAVPAEGCENGRWSGDAHRGASPVFRLLAGHARVDRRGVRPRGTGEGFGAQSMMVVPMVVREAVVGAITLIGCRIGPALFGTSLATRARSGDATRCAGESTTHAFTNGAGGDRSREDVLSFRVARPAQPADGDPANGGDAAPVRARRGRAPQGLEATGERIRRGVVQMRRMIDDLLDLAGSSPGN
jgi:hypothetical protein